MNKPLRIAIVEDDAAQRRILASMLASALRVVPARMPSSEVSPEITEFGEAIELLRLIDESAQMKAAFPFDVVVADVFMPIHGGSVPHPQGGAVRIYDAVKDARLDDRVIMLIVTIDVLGAEPDLRRIEEEQRGLEYQWAFFLSKPRSVSVSPTTSGISSEAWLSTVQTVIAHREDQVFRAKGFLRLPPTELLSQAFFAGAKMEIDALVSPGAAPYLFITGERGTPKDAVAKYFAQRLDRAGNLTALCLREGSEEVLAAYLFGKELPEPREGQLELRPNETVIIDEFCLPSKQREKLDKAVTGLLKSIAEHGSGSAQFYRLDGFQPKSFSGVLLLSCASLEELHQSDDMDESLIQLLLRRHVHVPSLREYPELIGSLAAHFLSKAGDRKKLTSGAVDTLRNYSWPGNVTELEDRLAALDREVDHEWISAADLGRIGFPVSPERPQPSEAPSPRPQKTKRSLRRSLLRLYKKAVAVPWSVKATSFIVGLLLLISGIVQGINALYDLRCKLRPASCAAAPPSSISPVAAPRPSAK